MKSRDEKPLEWEGLGIEEKQRRRKEKERELILGFHETPQGAPTAPPLLLRLLGEPDVRHLLSSLSLAH